MVHNPSRDLASESLFVFKIEPTERVRINDIELFVFCPGLAYRSDQMTVALTVVVCLHHIWQSLVPIFLERFLHLFHC